MTLNFDEYKTDRTFQTCPLSNRVNYYGQKTFPTRNKASLKNCDDMNVFFQELLTSKYNF